MLEALRWLAIRLPEELPLFLCLDVGQEGNVEHYFKAVNLESMRPFQLFLKGLLPQKYPYALPAFGWNQGSSPLGVCSSSKQLYPMLSSRRLPLALLLPTTLCGWEKISSVVEQLGQLPFRTLPEQLLTQEWEGVEDLVVISSGLSERGRRKLCGFCAAGGRVVTEGEPLNLEQEIPFMHWISKINLAQ